MRRVLVISLDVFGNSRTWILKCFEGKILLAELMKRTPGILRAKERKKIRKKGTRKV